MTTRILGYPFKQDIFFYFYGIYFEISIKLQEKSFQLILSLLFDIFCNIRKWKTSPLLTCIRINHGCIPNKFLLPHSTTLPICSVCIIYVLFFFFTTFWPAQYYPHNFLEKKSVRWFLICILYVWKPFKLYMLIKQELKRL